MPHLPNGWHTSLTCFCILYFAFTLGFTPAYAAPTPFPDMERSWFQYKEAVSYLREKGSISGYDDGTFRPKNTVNRAEFLKLVFRTRGTGEPVGGDCFADVKAGAWYAPYVCAAARRGIVGGYASGTGSMFKPDQPVIFAEAIKMMLRAYGKDIVQPPGEQWYEPYVQELDRAGILPSHSYTPSHLVTRERAADLIARFIRHEEDRVIARLSQGCGKSRIDTSGTLTVDGMERSYLLTVPRTAIEHDPLPLIVAFHGRTNSNERVRSYYGLDREADQFFIAYPAALQSGGSSYSWSNSGDKATELRDIAFFDAIVEQVANTYCIDMDRIFVVGHSLGAWFANSVACARGGVVRGSATVGGSSGIGDCAGPSAALIMNNPKDGSSPQASAEAMRWVRAKENTCSSQVEQTEPISLSCVHHEGCENNPIHFCPHTVNHERDGTYYPHLWPRETAQTIVKFFEDL